MKKITKVLLITVLAVALICAVALLSGAEAASKPEIVSKNIAYEGNFGIMYAVDASTVADGAVTLNIYSTDPAQGGQIVRTYVDTDTESIDAGVGTINAYVFKTEGVAAKDMADVFYAQAVDAKGNKSDVVAYSVVEYMLERLYGGYELSAEQEDLYRYALMFGEKAQKLLAKGETLVTDYRYITVGDEAYVQIKDTALALQLPDGYNRWKLTDLDTGAVTVLGANEAKVIGNVSVEPYLLIRGGGKYNSIAQSFTNTTATALKDAGKLTNTASMPAVTYDQVTTSTDYVMIDKKDGDDALLIGSTALDISRLLVNNFADNTVTECDDNYIFEADVNFEAITVAGYSGTRYFEIGFLKNFTDGTTDPYSDACVFASADPVNRPGEKFLTFGGLNGVTVSLVEGEWVNLRMEVANLRTAPVITYYVNGNSVGSFSAKAQSHEVDAVYFASSWGEVSGKVWVDNFYFSNVDDVAMAAQKGSRGEGANKDIALDFDMNSITALDQKAQGSMGNYPVSGNLSINLDSASNHYAKVTPVGGDAALEFGSAATFDPYFYISNDSAIGDVVENGTPATTADKDDYLFETDIMFNSITVASSSGVYFEFYFIMDEVMSGSLGGIQTECSFIILKDDGGYYLADCVTMDKIYYIPMGTWFNLRVEITDSTADSSTINYYINGEKVYEKGGFRVNYKGLPHLIMRYSWSETQGKVFLDNTVYTLK